MSPQELAVGGAIAVLSGLQAEEHIAHGEAVHQVIEVHEELGLITLGIYGFLTLWRIVRERRMGSRERGLSLLLSVGGLGVLVATGVYGGKLVFDHAAGIPSEVLQAELQERSEDHHHHDGASEPAATPDSSMNAPAGEHTDSPGAAPHTHAPGTPPHKD
jgi:hypothetical protein